MINTTESKLGQSVKMTELYDYLGLDKDKYSRFVKSNLVDSPFFDEAKDYLPFVASENFGKKGQFRQDYYVHIDCAKKICMVSKSKKGNEIRDELVKLTKQVEGGLMLSGKQFMNLVKIIKVFSVYEYRKNARDKNANTFVSELAKDKPNLPEGQLFAKFHAWRNEVLGTGKEVLDQRLKEYCIINEKAYNHKASQDQVLSMLGEYEHIRNAVWDLLSSQKQSQEFAQNVAALAQDLAKEMKPFLQRLNEADLFFEKIDKGLVSDVFRIS